MHHGSWVYPLKPINGAQEIDFAARVNRGIDVAGQTRTEALCGIGNLSPGDWTLYLQRKTWNVDAGFVDPADITGWAVQSGTDKGRADILNLERCDSPSLRTSVLSRLYRGVAIHVAASSVDVSVTYLVTGRNEDDRLLAWVAPGRPSPYYLQGAALTNVTGAPTPADRLRLPDFAVAIRSELQTVDPDFVAPQLCWWRGTTLVGVANLPVGPSSTRWLVPDNATHFSYRDNGVGALSDTIQFQVECFG